MKTLTIILIIWLLISVRNVHVASKKNAVAFNPFYASVFDFMGIVLGTAVIVVLIVQVFVNYAP